MPQPRGTLRKPIRDLISDGCRTVDALTAALIHRLPPEHVLRKYRCKLRGLARQRGKPGLGLNLTLEEEIRRGTRLVVTETLIGMRKAGQIARRDGEWYIVKAPREYDYGR